MLRRFSWPHRTLPHMALKLAAAARGIAPSQLTREIDIEPRLINFRGPTVATPPFRRRP